MLSPDSATTGPAVALIDDQDPIHAGIQAVLRTGRSAGARRGQVLRRAFWAEYGPGGRGVDVGWD